MRLQSLDDSYHAKLHMHKWVGPYQDSPIIDPVILDVLCKISFNKFANDMCYYPMCLLNLWRGC